MQKFPSASLSLICTVSKANSKAYIVAYKATYIVAYKGVENERSCPRLDLGRCKRR